MKIALTHMSDDFNRGDYAILAATHDVIRKKLKRARITAVSVELQNWGLDGIPETALTRELGCDVVGTPTPARRHFDGATWRWMCRLAWAEIAVLLAKLLGTRMFVLLPRDSREFIATLRGADLVIAKGGSYLYAKGGAREWLYLWRMLYPIRIAKMLSPRVVLLGVSIGEFESRGSRRLARAVVGKGVEVYVREAWSMRRAREELRVPAIRVRMLPDLAFLTRRRTNWTTTSGKGVRVGVTVRTQCFAAGDLMRARKKYIHATAIALRQLLEGPDVERVSFVPQVHEDLPLAREIAELVGLPEAVTVVARQPNLQALLTMYEDLDVLLGARLHSVILAAVVGVPAVHVVYEPSKSWGTLDLLDMTRLGIRYEDVTAERLLEKLAYAVRHRAELSAALGRKVPELRLDIERAVADVLGRSQSMDDRQG